MILFLKPETVPLTFPTCIVISGLDFGGSKMKSKNTPANAGVFFALLLFLASAIPAKAHVLWSYDVGESHSRVVITDINEDGCDDVVILDNAEQVRVLSGIDGSTVLWSYQVSNAARYRRGLATISDLDGDGVKDIILILGTSGNGYGENHNDDELYAVSGAVMPPGERILWGGPIHIGCGLNSPIILPDVNGDGKEDIFANTSTPTCSGSGDAGYHFSGADGSLFWTFVIYAEGAIWDIYGRVASPDLNGDSLADIVITGAGGSGGVEAWKGGPTKGKIWRSLTGEWVLNPTVVPDITGDGIPEVAVSSGPNTPFKLKVLNGSDGSLVWERPFGNAVYPTGDLGDINDDGFADIALGTYYFSGWSPQGNEYIVHVLNGNPGAADRVIWSYEMVDKNSYVTAVDDMNDDGKKDLMVWGANAKVMALSGTDGSLIWEETFSTGTGGVQVGEFSGTGGQDFLTSSGNEIFALSSNVLLSISTAEATSVTTNSAVSGGEVISEGGAPVTARGVCWSTSANPTIADSHTTDGSGLGSFTSNLTGLSNQTTYYVRAWATNLVGTAYGNEITFTTGVHPELTTQEASDLGMWSATGYGTVTNVGTPAPTQHGLCWNTYGMPDILWDDYTEEGPVTATGTFTSEPTKLSPGTLYYVRAYATNTNGTVYGNEISFSTLSSTAPGACFSDSGQRLGAIWPEYPDDYTYSHGVALGDLNGDNYPDAFVVNAHCNPNTVWFNDGSGTFTDSGQRLGLIPDPAYPEDYAPSRRVSLGDLDGDGDLDAFVANGGNQADTVWFNDGAGTFTDSGQRLGFGIDPLYPTGYTTSHGLALGDLDGDGDLDAFVANADETPNTVWFNNGSGSFSDSTQRLGGAVCSKSVALGDLNNDGHLDAFVGNGNGSINAVFLNDGTGTFSLLTQPDFTDDTTAHDVALGDLDGDNDLDVYVARGLSEPDQIWFNDGAALFSNSGQALGGDLCSHGVALGDVDGDGDVDAFTVKAAGEANQLFLNNGNGQFSPAATMGQSSSHGVGLSDLNSDGTLDAFVANANGEPNKVWFNRAGAFISGTVYASDGTTPLQGIAITVNLYSGNPCDQPQLLASTTTDPTDGTYSLGCLFPGTYYLQAGGGGYQSEWWALPSSVVACQNTQPIVLNAADQKNGINFQLSLIAPQTFYVNIVNGDDNNDGSSDHPWKTLHHAISQINAGQPGTYVLNVGAGTYGIETEADAQLILTQSNVTLLGESSASVIIDGANTPNWTTGLEITGENVMIKHISVTGFSNTDEEGIRISNGTGNEIRNCSIYGNNWGIRVWFSGGSVIEDCEIFGNITHGIDIVRSTETVVVHNSIHNNPQYGIRVESSPKISRNLIFDNRCGIFIFAQGYEGRVSTGSNPLIVNNVIYEQTAGKVDYGILINTGEYGSTNPEIYHNTLDRGTYDGILIETYGTSTANPAILYNIITNFSQYGIENSGGNPWIDYNDVWNNASGNYKDCEGFIGSNNISDNPLYGSYTLQSNSPCINKIPASSGDPVDIDYSGFTRPRPLETAKDMGAYEYVGNITDPYTLPGGTGQITDYRIFTVPFYMTGAQMLAAMENVLGPYNNTSWRGFASVGGNYLEFNDGSFQTLSIIPGMGFWMISLRTDTIPFEGRTAPDGVHYEKKLSPGWHMMGLPWVSENINLGSIKVTDGINTYAVTSSENMLTQRCVWDYTGTGPYNGYEKRDLSTDNLQCGAGYFFKVLSTNNVTIIIPPKSDVSSFRRGERGSTGNEEEPPPPPGGRACPEFHDGRLINFTFPKGGECTYSGEKSYILGNGVTIENGATVTIKPIEDK